MEKMNENDYNNLIKQAKEEIKNRFPTVQFRDKFNCGIQLFSADDMAAFAVDFYLKTKPNKKNKIMNNEKKELIRFFADVMRSAKFVYAKHDEFTIFFDLQVELKTSKDTKKYNTLLYLYDIEYMQERMQYINCRLENFLTAKLGNNTPSSNFGSVVFRTKLFGIDAKGIFEYLKKKKDFLEIYECDLFEDLKKKKDFLEIYEYHIPSNLDFKEYRMYINKFSKEFLDSLNEKLSIFLSHFADRYDNLLTTPEDVLTDFEL
ncbi:MAG: hypothetical protein LDL10_01000 [Calditerrivibrio sp.]|nr:hypothetical protein [Calditerrivibrio sp.]